MEENVENTSPKPNEDGVSRLDGNVRKVLYSSLRGNPDWIEKLSGRDEQLFRSVVSDLKLNRDSRPVGFFIPNDLLSDLDLKEMNTKYGKVNRDGISYFSEFMIKGDIIEITYRNRNMYTLSGGGATIRYSIDGDKVVFKDAPIISFT